MKLFTKNLTLFFTSIVLLFCFYNVVHASSSSGYEVVPMLPQNMSKLGYFEYDYRPNKRFSVKFNVKNNTGNSIMVNNSVNNAYSDNNGYINYNLSNVDSYIDSQFPKFTSMLTGKQSIQMKLPPYSSKEGNFYFKMPANLSDFRGAILGGINSTSSYQFGSSASNINNRLQYSTSILVNLRAKPADLKKITLDSAKSTENTGILKISNRQYSVLSRGQVLISLTHGGQRIFNLSNPAYSLAPNSFGYYKFNYGNLKPGRYKVTFKISKDNQSKTMSRYIIIRKSYTNNLVQKSNKTSIWFIIVPVLIIILLLFLVNHRFNKL